MASYRRWDTGTPARRGGGEEQTDVVGMLLEARKSRNISQAELSERTGIAQADISRIENRRRNPSLSMIEKLAAGMGLAFRLEPVR